MFPNRKRVGIKHNQTILQLSRSLVGIVVIEPIRKRILTTAIISRNVVFNLKKRTRQKQRLHTVFLHYHIKSVKSPFKSLGRKKNQTILHITRLKRRIILIKPAFISYIAETIISKAVFNLKKRTRQKQRLHTVFLHYHIKSVKSPFKSLGRKKNQTILHITRLKRRIILIKPTLISYTVEVLTINIRIEFIERIRRKIRLQPSLFHHHIKSMKARSNRLSRQKN